MGLATVVCAWFSGAALTRAMNPANAGQLLLAQTIGVPHA
jgi:hypothetical protein